MGIKVNKEVLSESGDSWLSGSGVGRIHQEKWLIMHF